MGRFLRLRDGVQHASRPPYRLHRIRNFFNFRPFTTRFTRVRAGRRIVGVQINVIKVDLAAHYRVLKIDENDQYDDRWDRLFQPSSGLNSSI